VAKFCLNFIPHLGRFEGDETISIPDSLGKYGEMLKEQSTKRKRKNG